MVDVAAVQSAKGNTEKAACRVLRQLASQVPANECIVELGAYKGRTTGWLALGAQEGNGAEVVAVDPWDLRSPDDWPDDYADHLAFDTYGRPETLDAFRSHIAACGFRHLPTVIIRTAVEAASLTDWSPVGLLYHDADHTAAAVRSDLEAWIPHLADRCTVALHDAGNPRFGVLAGAEVLADHGFDWDGRTLKRWSKHPERRGLLVVHRS